MAIGVQNFVVSKMGERFVKPPVFDLNACFDDSSCATPLVFILSPGSDPMGAVLKAADGMGVKVWPDEIITTTVMMIWFI